VIGEGDLLISRHASKIADITKMAQISVIFATGLQRTQDDTHAVLERALARAVAELAPRRWRATVSLTDHGLNVVRALLIEPTVRGN